MNCGKCNKEINPSRIKALRETKVCADCSAFLYLIVALIFSIQIKGQDCKNSFSGKVFDLHDNSPLLHEEENYDEDVVDAEIL